MINPDVRMSHPPFAPRVYPPPERPEPFFRDAAPGFQGISSAEGASVIATSTFGGEPEPMPPQVRNVFEPTEVPMNEDVPVQAPGDVNPLLSSKRRDSLKAPPQKEPRKDTGAAKRQEELNKRRRAEPPPPTPPPFEFQSAKTGNKRSKPPQEPAGAPPPAKRRAPPPPAPPRVPEQSTEEFGGFAANKRQMSRLGRPDVARRN